MHSTRDVISLINLTNDLKMFIKCLSLSQCCTISRKEWQLSMRKKKMDVTTLRERVEMSLFQVWFANLRNLISFFSQEKKKKKGIVILHSLVCKLYSISINYFFSIMKSVKREKFIDLIFVRQIKGFQYIFVLLIPMYKENALQFMVSGARRFVSLIDVDTV